MIVRFTDRAQSDLDDVYDWIVPDNPPRARSYVDEIISAAEQISDFPEAYPVLEVNSRRPLRRKRHGSHLIVYEIATDHIEIVAIVHVARDLDALFG